MSSHFSVNSKPYQKLLIKDNEIKIRSPGLCLLLGSNNTGKSTLIRDMIYNRKRIFTPEISEVHFMFSYSQPIYAELEAKLGSFITFHQGLREELFEPGVLPPNALIVADDLDQAVYSSAVLARMATGGLHHNRLLMLVSSQQVYYNPGSAKYAKEFIKQAKVFIVTQLIKEKYALRHWAVQLNVSPSYLLSAYETSVERPPTDRTLSPPHLLINYQQGVRDQLRLIGNFVLPLHNNKRTSTEDDSSRDLKAESRWLFSPTGVNVRRSSTGKATSLESTAAATIRESSNWFIEMDAGASSTSSTLGASRLFYLLTETQMKNLQTSTNNESTKKIKLTEVVEEKKKPQLNAPPQQHRSEWFDLTTEVIPSMLEYSEETRRKMIHLSKYMRSNGFELHEDGSLTFYIDPGRREKTDVVDVDSKLSITESNAIDVLLYFTTPSVVGSRLGRPRALFELCKALAKAPERLFHKTKLPNYILKKKF